MYYDLYEQFNIYCINVLINSKLYSGNYLQKLNKSNFHSLNMFLSLMFSANYETKNNKPL